MRVGPYTDLGGDFRRADLGVHTFTTTDFPELFIEPPLSLIRLSVCVTTPVCELSFPSLHDLGPSTNFYAVDGVHSQRIPTVLFHSV